MKKFWFLGMVFSLSLLGMKSLHAFTQGACRQDAMKFCQAVIPDEEKVKKCLFEHRTKVSDPCKENIKETIDKKKDAQAAGAPKGGGTPKEQSSGY